MKRIANGWSKTSTTVKIFLFCFALYFISNAFQK